MASNSKRKRNVLNIQTKLEILNPLAKGESGESLAQFYNVVNSTILDIRKDPSNADAFSDSYGVVRTTIRVLSYSTIAAQGNRRPCSETTKVYNGTAKNK
ncbi:UNVERIFIED_CONTAM: hypothetical protein NCL1_05222 [Trichonephila clavipes]